MRVCVCFLYWYFRMHWTTNVFVIFFFIFCYNVCKYNKKKSSIRHIFDFFPFVSCKNKAQMTSSIVMILFFSNVTCKKNDIRRMCCCATCHGNLLSWREIYRKLTWIWVRIWLRQLRIGRKKKHIFFFSRLKKAKRILSYFIPAEPIKQQMSHSESIVTKYFTIWKNYYIKPCFFVLFPLD